MNLFLQETLTHEGTVPPTPPELKDTTPVSTLNTLESLDVVVVTVTTFISLQLKTFPIAFPDNLNSSIHMPLYVHLLVIYK